MKRPSVNTQRARAESGVQNGGERNFASVTVYSYRSDGNEAIAADIREGGKGGGRGLCWKKGCLKPVKVEDIQCVVVWREERKMYVASGKGK